MRRTIPVLLLVSIVCGIAWWLWSWRAVQAPPPDPWSVVPSGAVAVLEVPAPLAAWNQFTGTSQFWGELEGTAVFGGIDALLLRLAQADPAMGAKQEQPLLIAWSATNGDSLAALIAWPMEATPTSLQALGTALRTQFPPSLQAGNILPIRPDSLLPPLLMAWDKGLLLISADRSLLEQALLHTGSDKAVGSPFAQARASLSVGADAHLLVRPDYASQLLGLEGEGVFPQGVQVQGWAAMDIRLRPGAVLMNGLLFPDEVNPALASIAQQQAARPDIIRVLPSSVCRLRAVQISDAESYVRNLSTKPPDQDLFAAYASWVHGTIGVAGEAHADDSTANRWAVFGTDDPGKAATALLARCPDAGCPAAEYRGIKFQRIADTGVLAPLFGSEYAAFDQPYWTVLSDMVVMSNTPAGMRAAIDAWTDRNSLALDPRSGDFFQRFGSEAVYSWWVDVANAYPAGHGTFGAARKATGGALLQVSPRADGKWVATFCLQHAPEGKRAAGALWTTALAAPPEGPLLLVKDYLSKTLQVLVQDRDHRLSLISCTGKLLWQRQLDGPLLGGVHQVDRYRNGKLQMVLGTAGKVYMIDRLGRDVEDFPVGLKDSASAPISVFDYDGHKDYRVLVPTVSGGLLNLGMNGKPVNGWTPKDLPAPAIAAVEHARIRGKDFLVLPLQNGRIAVLDRRGEERHNSKLHMEHLAAFLGSRGSMYIGDRRLLWTDSAGAVLSGTVDGQVDTLSMPASGKVAVFDVDGDGHDEVLRATVSALTVESAGKPLFRVSYPDAVGAAAFPVLLEEAVSAIGVVLPEQGQVRMYDRTGELWPGFPLAGAVPFQVADINLDGVPEVVTADRDGVVSVHALTPEH